MRPRHPFPPLPRLSSPVLLLVALVGVGCHTPAPPLADAHAPQPHVVDEVRQQLDLIPPPSKTRYMAVRSLATWENPYLTVQGGMATLHVTLADANTSGLGQGGLLRPAGARQQALNIDVNALPAALNAIPPNSWPYGRVIAIEEAHNVPEHARPEVRRTMEAVIKTLGDLDVVIYEWQEGGAGLR